MNKVEWFKKEKNDFFKGIPKKDGSGGGMRLNKGRGGCPPEKQEKFGKGEFSPERALKVVGGLAMLGVGIHLAKEIID
jgi:hypothetical protein